MSSRQAIAAAFATLQAAGLRPPQTFDAQAVELWAQQLDAGDGEIANAARAWLNTARGKWWPTLAEFVTLLPRRAIAAGPSRCPTYDALTADERAVIGEAILVDARQLVDGDLDAECERRARVRRAA